MAKSVEIYAPYHTYPLPMDLSALCKRVTGNSRFNIIYTASVNNHIMFYSSSYSLHSTVTDTFYITETSLALAFRLGVIK